MSPGSADSGRFSGTSAVNGMRVVPSPGRFPARGCDRHVDEKPPHHRHRPISRRHDDCCCVPLRKSIRFLSNPIESGKMPACEDCFYFAATRPAHPSNGRLPGQCRRYPPVVNTMITQPGGAPITQWPGVWPAVPRTEWCGEFKSNVQPTSIYDHPELVGPPALTA